jgi:DNA repair protein RecO (recombination protein O)
MTQQHKPFLILRKIKYGESDLIIHALSPLGEKISFMARGALRSKKRFGGGVLEPGHHVLLTYKEAPLPGKMSSLQEASLLADFKHTRRSYDHLEFALFVLECAGKVGQEGDDSSSFLYNLVGHTLKAIETCVNLNLVKVQFYLKFLMQQGVMTLEPWMKPFLTAKISEVDSLLDYQDLAEQKEPLIKNDVRHYLENAEAAHFSALDLK